MASKGNNAAQAYGLEMKQCIPAYQVIFDDGDTISLGFPRSKCSDDYAFEEIKQIQMMEQESISKFNSLAVNGNIDRVNSRPASILAAPRFNFLVDDPESAKYL